MPDDGERAARRIIGQRNERVAGIVNEWFQTLPYPHNERPRNTLIADLQAYVDQLLQAGYTVCNAETGARPASREPARYVIVHHQPGRDPQVYDIHTDDSREDIDVRVDWLRDVAKSGGRDRDRYTVCVLVPVAED